MKAKLAAALAVAIFLISTVAMFAPVSAKQPTIPSPNPASGSTLVLDLKYHVINDEDSGFIGYWALTHYAKHIQVWTCPTGETAGTDASPCPTANGYYAFITYDGGWHTFAGALSPQNGVTESRDAAGNENGFLEFTFTADSATPFAGNLPTKDYGGGRTDILLGSYGKGQTGDNTVFSWTSVYFTNFGSEANSNWAFYYYMGNKLSWVNAAFCIVSGGSVDCNSVHAPNDIVV